MSPLTRADKWTHRQRELVRLHASGMDMIDAARAAGFSESYAKAINKFLPRFPHIMAAVGEIRRAVCDQVKYDLATAMTQAGEDREFAYREKNPNAAVKASELRSKLSGLLIDRIEVTAVDLTGALQAARGRVIVVSTQSPQAAEQADTDKAG